MLHSFSSPLPLSNGTMQELHHSLATGPDTQHTFNSLDHHSITVKPLFLRNFFAMASTPGVALLSSSPLPPLSLLIVLCSFYLSENSIRESPSNNGCCQPQPSWQSQHSATPQNTLPTSSVHYLSPSSKGRLHLPRILPRLPISHSLPLFPLICISVPLCFPHHTLHLLSLFLYFSLARKLSPSAVQPFLLPCPTLRNPSSSTHPHDAAPTHTINPC